MGSDSAYVQEAGKKTRVDQEQVNTEKKKTAVTVMLVMLVVVVATITAGLIDEGKEDQLTIPFADAGGCRWMPVDAGGLLQNERLFCDLDLDVGLDLDWDWDLDLDVDL
ncbi:hypothetical protein GQ42DRAFT_171797 [Ramicandelaber brevisporus]|nr:hypothetical protein GQ42DRAFT_171797 [Ramicandelaber brevisporus]